ncbi:transcriptional regulator [Duganella rhizosphaerae]|uniref:AraC family transcriptional regulator n=1 Tax=Duganella rhizosphaerae TaxID=2885763 RepID=UPI0030E9612B
MNQPTTSGAWLNGIWDLLTTIGMDPRSIFAAAGIDTAAMQDPHRRIDSDQLSTLWNLITAASGNEAIALESPDSPRPATLDLLAYTMMTAPTMGAALQRFMRYIRIISDAAVFTMEDDPRGGQWLRLAITGGSVPVPRQRCEFVLITILNICRWIAGRSINPIGIELVHAEPGSTQAHARAFAGPLRFNAPSNGILFATADLDAPLPASNPRLAELHERYAAEFLQQMDKDKLTARVRELIVRSLPDGDPPRAAAAAALHISERTLQRRLQDEGTSFQQLLDDTRRDMARQYLAQEQIVLGQIAFMLGFADQSTFCRACQRWFTASPGQYRRQLTCQAAVL